MHTVILSLKKRNIDEKFLIEQFWIFHQKLHNVTFNLCPKYPISEESKKLPAQTGVPEPHSNVIVFELESEKKPIVSKYIDSQYAALVLSLSIIRMEYKNYIIFIIKVLFVNDRFFLMAR